MSDKTPENNNKLIIEGITKSGEKFRPADWAERVSGSLSTFRNRRIIYSPLLRPATNKSGNKCIIIDNNLKQSNPSLYENLVEFAKKNNLKTNEDIEKDNKNKN